MSTNQPSSNPSHPPEDDDTMLDPSEAAEEIPSDGDAPMDSDDEDADAPLEEIALQNDSAAHFDAHRDSIFCIAAHPLHPHIVVTGGGDDLAYIFDSRPPPPPVLPPSYESDPRPRERASIAPLQKLDGHTDSVNAVAFTLPSGAYALTAGLDGRLRAWQGSSSGREWTFLAEAQEVEEINWLAACPASPASDPSRRDAVALGASDGSVWVYRADASDAASPLSIVQALYGHTAPCTAGAWTPDGRLLVTVAEDGGLRAWDVWGDAAAAGVLPAGGQAVVSLDADDERFRVDGGLYSVAVAPNGALAAAGGAEGQIRVVGLPRPADPAAAAGAGTSKGGAGARSKHGGAKQAGGAGGAAGGQTGQILASLQAGTDSVEALAFAAPPLTLLAAGNVDGSVTLFDAAHRFAARRRIPRAHGDDEAAGDGEAEAQAVIALAFARDPGAGWLLTSCGNDGVLRRWDARGGTAAPGRGLVGEWRGHRGGGDGGGILGFVQDGEGRFVVTAGDDGVALVFDTKAG